MKKQQQFFIFKFSSARLAKAKFKVEISLEQARINSELIAINNSELVRALFRYKRVEFSQNSLDFILKMRKRLQKLPNTDENREKMQIFNEKLENMLFIEDLVTVEFENKSHYRAILKNRGFYVNGIRFTPFMASAGMIRRNTALFINNNVKHPLMDILENGRNEKTPVVPAKLGAYFSLYSSSTLPVSFPNFAVVKDTEIQSLRKVDFVSYKGVGEDDDVTERDMVLKFNAFDGQGLISPRLAEEWSKELDLDYTFSCAVIRAPYLKGLVCVFDFHSFAVEVAKEEHFTDIYGNNVSVWDVDLIISESMFKLYNAYESTQDYVDKCEENGLGFSIAKVNPKVERSYSRTSYQFLQVLNLNDVDIARLCEPTIDWFRNISGGSAMDMLLYATGENMFTEEDFKRMDVITKAILLDPLLSRDKYIQERFSKTVEKRKKESYMGGILINANYQFMIADPYFQAATIFNPNALPLLIEGEYFSNYWNEKGVEKVAAIRSPIVHHSEFNVLTFRKDDKVQKWFSHIKSGIIYPANGIGVDWVRHGGAD